MRSESEREKARINESLNVIVMEKLFNPPLTPVLALPPLSRSPIKDSLYLVRQDVECT